MIRELTPTRRRLARDGFIVVAVLWILGALATLASIYAVYVVDTAVAFGVHDDRLQAEALVSAGLELAAYQMTATPDSAQTTPDNARARGAFAFRLGRANVGVEFRPEAARVDLNAAPKELLTGLFVTLGARPESAETYAERIVGWRTPASEGQDPEASLYRTAGLLYPPRGGKFAHIGELSLVLGLPALLVDRALPFLTVYSGQPQISVLDAAPEVLAALPGMTPDRLQAVLLQRQATPQNGEAVIALLGPAQAHASLERGKATRVSVRIEFDNGRRMSSNVVLLVFNQGNEPYSVLSWRDELDDPVVDERARTAYR